MDPCGSSPLPSSPTRIAVGSQQPAKVAAATVVLQRAFPGAEVVALGVEGGVGPLPLSVEETIRGALERARRALREGGADLGVGIEDGLEETPHGTFLGSWAAAIDRRGRVGLGAGMRILLPPEVVQAVRRGEDLGQIVREHSSLVDSETGGAIGWLTRGLVTREEAHRHAVAAALAPFLPGAVQW
ncbi:MAG: inosine/xanthosine triphosphatase [Armatimonadota bacterium]|nr:inosine/xanthosine triphosphatase [Armatimonadota bacterium]MDR7464544.1 inosine/xanthosine triphosphatase [Armatimonadota bacterium]